MRTPGSRNNYAGKRKICAPGPENSAGEIFNVSYWTVTFTHRSTQREFEAYFFKSRRIALIIWCFFILVLLSPIQVTLYRSQKGLKMNSYFLVEIIYLVVAEGTALFTLLILLVQKKTRYLEDLIRINYLWVFLGMFSYTIWMQGSSSSLYQPVLAMWIYIMWYALFLGYVTQLHINFPQFLIGNATCLLAMIFGSLSLEEISCGPPINTSTMVWSSIVAIFMSAVFIHSALRTRCDLFKSYQVVQKNKRKEIKQKVLGMKRQYVAQTLHDIGTPLATLTLVLEGLEQGDLTEDLKDVVQTGLCALEMMVLTRKKALDFARVQHNGVLVPHFAETDLRHILQYKCPRIMTGFNSGTEVELRYWIDERIAPRVITDGDWIWEMLCNYLSNGLKFTVKGFVEAKIFLTDDEKQIMFEVKDTGKGVTDKQKKYLFRPFSQLQDDAGGTGLGLYNTFCRVKALQGSIGVRDNTECGHGSIFFFSIPYTPCVEGEGDAFRGVAESKEAFDAALLEMSSTPPPSVTNKYVNTMKFPVRNRVDSIDSDCSSRRLRSTDRLCQIDEGVSRLPFFLKRGSGGGPSVRPAQSFMQSFHYQTHPSTATASPSEIGPSVGKRRFFPSENSSEASVSCCSFTQVSRIDSKREPVGIFQMPRKEKKINVVASKPSPVETNSHGQFSQATILEKESDGGSQCKTSEGLQSFDASDEICFSKVAQALSQVSSSQNESSSEECKNRGLHTLKVDKSLTRADSTEYEPQKGGVLHSLKVDTSFDQRDYPKARPSPLQLDAKISPFNERERTTIGCSEIELESGHILLVEDENSIAKLVTRMLNRAGFQVTHAQDGIAGLQKMKETNYLVVLCDITMPGMNGFDCVKLFRKWEQQQMSALNRSSKQVVIALSATQIQEDQQRAIECGFTSFLSKPVKIQELLAKIEAETGCAGTNYNARSI